MKKELAQQILNKVKDDYNNIASDFSSTRAVVWPEVVSLFDYIKKEDIVLDLGCGNGRFVNIIKEKGGVYLGCDVSENLINIAKKNYPNESFQVTEPLSLPFSDNHFDVTYSIAVLHHIPSKEFRLEFLQQAKRVLKKGGIFVLTAWKPKDKQERFLKIKFWLKKVFGLASGLDYGDVIEKWFGNNKGERYFHCFTKVELIKLARQVNFEVLKCGVIKNEKGNRQNLYIVLRKE